MSTQLFQLRPGVPLPSPESLKRKILVKNKKNEDVDYQVSSQAVGMSILNMGANSMRVESDALGRMDALASQFALATSNTCDSLSSQSQPQPQANAADASTSAAKSTAQLSTGSLRRTSSTSGVASMQTMAQSTSTSFRWV